MNVSKYDSFHRAPEDVLYTPGVIFRYMCHPPSTEIQFYKNTFLYLEHYLIRKFNNMEVVWKNWNMSDD